MKNFLSIYRSILTTFSNPDLIPSLVECFEERIWCEDDALRLQCSETVAGLLSVLANLGVHTSRDIYKLGHQLLASVVDKVSLSMIYLIVADQLGHSVTTTLHKHYIVMLNH